MSVTQTEIMVRSKLYQREDFLDMLKEGKMMGIRGISWPKKSRLTLFGEV